MLPIHTTFDKLFLSNANVLEGVDKTEETFLCSRGAKTSDILATLQVKL